MLAFYTYKMYTTILFVKSKANNNKFGKYTEWLDIEYALLLNKYRRVKSLIDYYSLCLCPYDFFWSANKRISFD